MARDTHGNTVEGWKRLIDALAGQDDIPGMTGYRERLQVMYQEALDLAAQRDAHRAAKQAAARALKENLENGRKLATAMRSWLKTHYGHGSEKLVEFGIRPLRRPRGKRRKPSE